MQRNVLISSSFDIISNLYSIINIERKKISSTATRIFWVNKWHKGRVGGCTDLVNEYRGDAILVLDLHDLRGGHGHAVLCPGYLQDNFILFSRLLADFANFLFQ